MSDAATEKLASWMCEHYFSTGHGENMDDLLEELSWQVSELRSTVHVNNGSLHPEDEIL